MRPRRPSLVGGQCLRRRAAAKARPHRRWVRYRNWGENLFQSVHDAGPGIPGSPRSCRSCTLSANVTRRLVGDTWATDNETGAAPLSRRCATAESTRSAGRSTRRGCRATSTRRTCGPSTRRPQRLTGDRLAEKAAHRASPARRALAGASPARPRSVIPRPACPDPQLRGWP